MHRTSRVMHVAKLAREGWRGANGLSRFHDTVAQRGKLVLPSCLPQSFLFPSLPPYIYFLLSFFYRSTAAGLTPSVFRVSRKRGSRLGNGNLAGIVRESLLGRFPLALSTVRKYARCGRDTVTGTRESKKEGDYEGG